MTKINESKYILHISYFDERGVITKATLNEKISSHCDHLVEIFGTERMKITNSLTKETFEFNLEKLKKNRLLSFNELLYGKKLKKMQITLKERKRRFNLKVGEKLRKIRNKNGLTLNEMAKVINKSKVCYQQYEKGRKKESIRLVDFLVIARKFDVDIEEFLKGM